LADRLENSQRTTDGYESALRTTAAFLLMLEQGSFSRIEEHEHCVRVRSFVDGTLDCYAEMTVE
jgi:hypothetical protein